MFSRVSSSFSKPERVWKHDVFICFRGEDTRKNFVSHLYAALTNAGINTFLDDEKLEKGQMLKDELWLAIEESRIHIVVFSEAFAESTCCLGELVKIMDCHRRFRHPVLPIFYDVEPSDVRYKMGTFGESLLRLEIGKLGSTEFDPADCWYALSEAADLAGWDMTNRRSDSKIVKEIVDRVRKELGTGYLSIPDFPIGLESRVQDVIQFIDGQSSAACVVVIWGIGGSGKTTLAKAIYNKIHRNFEYKSFLENITEVCENDRGYIDLQEQLLSDILMTKVKNIRSIALGKDMIEKGLSGERVLLVFDDVSTLEQLHALYVNSKWIDPGSVIIATTRDKHLLRVLRADYVYTMKEMDENESLELFSWHAFMKASPRVDLIGLSRNVVTYCGGLPLALEVLGSYLFGRKKEEWKSVLSKLERIPKNEIQKKLKISFDGLEDDTERDIFLDICCFFIGMDRAYVTEILNGCGLYAETGITILIERSLLKVGKNNKLGMHSLLRDMGREIISENSPKMLGNRSRLWFYEDVCDVLTRCTGTEAVEGLAMKSQINYRVHFDTIAFEKMNRLRLLQLDHVQLDGDYEYLSKNLRWLCWKGFPSEYIPNNFYQGNLVGIDLKHSNLKLVWKEPQLLEMLKVLNLSHSMHLRSTPDFSKLPNLEKLILKDCPSLSNVHKSIGDLSNLHLINLKDCTSLNNLPRTIYRLTSLKTLIIFGCSKIDKLEEDIVQMKSLSTLCAKNTAIEQVPFSVARSKSIGYISLCGYEGLSRDVFPSLIRSWMSPTMNPLSHIDPFGGMLSSLVSTNIQNNNLGDLLPMLSGLSKLRSAWVQYGSEFQLTQDLRRILDAINNVNFTELETTSHASQMSKHSLKSLLIGMGSYHQVINTLSKSLSQELTFDGSTDFFLLGDNYPYWLTYTGEGHSVPFNVPHNSDCHMKGMVLCVVYSSTPENMGAECLISVLVVNYTKYTIQFYKRDTTISFNDEDWQGIISNLGAGAKVEIFVAFGHGVIVKKTAVYLIYVESVDLKMEPPPEPKKSDFIPRKRMRM